MQNSLSVAQLQSIATALDGKTSDHSALGNQNAAGLWRRIAKALEDGAGVSNTRNENLHGYMERAALAAEAKWGGDGNAENLNQRGLMKRVIDAFEISAGAVTTGSYANRLQVAAPLVTFGATSLSTPDINATNTAGTAPLVDIGLKSDHYANDFLDVQRSATSNFAVLTMDISYQITMEDFSDGITNAELVTEGYTAPSGGVYYQRYRIRRADGAYSAWVGFSGDTSAGVSATLVGAQRQFVNYGYSTATFNFTFADAGLAVFQIFVDNQPLNATPQMDGVNLTLVTSSVNATDGSIYLYQGAVTAGVHSLTFTYPYNLYANAAAFLVKGTTSTPVDPFSQFFTGSDATVPHVPSHGALAVPSGGVGIAALGIVSGANTDTTWINGTEAYDAGDASTPTANKHSAAIFTTAQVPSFSGQDFRKTSFVAAAWGP